MCAHHYYKSRLMQSGAKQWCFKLAANNFLVHSPQTGVRFYSSPDTTEFLTVVETPWRNCCASQELFSRKKPWGEPVSVVLQGGVSATKMCKKKMSPSGAAGSGGTVSSDGVLRQVRSRRLWARLIVETQPGTIPSVSPRWLSGGCFPVEANGTAALWQRVQIFRSLAASSVNGATATPIYPPGSA